MTKKDFEAIASALKDGREALRSAEDDADAATERMRSQVFDSMSRSLADVCAKTNPRFNRSRFLAACGVAGY